MKIFSILKKNLLNVSRSWGYFFVLLVFPVILILIAGVILNSFDTSNMQVGIYDSLGDGCSQYSSEDENSFILKFDNYHCFDSLEACLDKLGSSKIGLCLNIEDHGEQYRVDVYLDNSKKLIEYYSKQLIFEQVLGSQTTFVEETAEEMENKLALYSNALIDTRADLIQTKADLNEQKETLIERQEELEQTKKDFDEIYIPLKEMEPEINLMIIQITNNKNTLEEETNNFNANKQNIEQNIALLQLFLGPRLNNEGDSYTDTLFGDILNDLNEMDSTLKTINEVQQTNDLLAALDLIKTIIPKLDKANETLTRANEDLTGAIQKIEESEEKVDGYILELDETTKDLKLIGQNIEIKPTNLNFKKAFDISDNIVLLSFPLLVSIIITFTSLILSNLFIIRQVHQASYFREIISPTWDVNFIIADYFINLLFIAIQATVLFAVGLIWIGIPTSALLPYSIIILILSSFFIFIGMSFGYLIKSSSLSMLVTIFLVMLLFIVSDLIIPTSLTSPIVRLFTELNPFVIIYSLLKNVFIINQSLIEIYPKLIFPAFLLLFSIIAMSISRKINKKRKIS